METNPQQDWPEVRVIIYEAEPEPGAGCVQCQATKRNLDKFGIPYTTRTIAKDDEETRIHMRGNGIDDLGQFQPQTPILVIVRADEEYDPGFRPLNPERLNQLDEYNPNHVVLEGYTGFRPDILKDIPKKYDVVSSAQELVGASS